MYYIKTASKTHKMSTGLSPFNEPLRFSQLVVECDRCITQITSLILIIGGIFYSILYAHTFFRVELCPSHLLL